VQGVISQLVPEKPLGHAQLHDAGGPELKTLTPPFSHVIKSHGFISQSMPVNPSRQEQIYPDPSIEMFLHFGMELMYMVLLRNQFH
jgi:hypothetical protein